MRPREERLDLTSGRWADQDRADLCLPLESRGGVQDVAGGVVLDAAPAADPPITTRPDSIPPAR